MNKAIIHHEAVESPLKEKQESLLQRFRIGYELRFLLVHAA